MSSAAWAARNNTPPTSKGNLKFTIFAVLQSPNLKDPTFGKFAFPAFGHGSCDGHAQRPPRGAHVDVLSRAGKVRNSSIWLRDKALSSKGQDAFGSQQKLVNFCDFTLNPKSRKVLISGCVRPLLVICHCLLCALGLFSFFAQIAPTAPHL